MKLYLLEQDVNNDYDTYDSCVVAAESEEEARYIHPSEGNYFSKGPIDWSEEAKDKFAKWANFPEQVQVTYLGEAKPGTKRGVICASFNAG